MCGLITFEDHFNNTILVNYTTHKWRNPHLTNGKEKQELIFMGTQQHKTSKERFSSGSNQCLEGPSKGAINLRVTISGRDRKHY